MCGDEKYADCTVRVGPTEACETFRANRTLLARCSEVFGKMFFEQPMQEERSAEVHIPDCTGDAFRELIRCSHDLDPDIQSTNFIEVFRLAQKYEVEELREAVADWIGEALAIPALALRALDAAQARGVTVHGGGVPGSSSCVSEAGGAAACAEEDLARMLEACLQTAALRGEGLLDAGALFGCSPQTVALLVQQENLCCDEEHLWCSLMHWAEDQEGRDTLRAVAPHVRFNIMSSEFFVDEVVPTGVLEPGEVVELLSSRATGRPTATFPNAALPRSGVPARWGEPGEEDAGGGSAEEEEDDSDPEGDDVSTRGAPGRLQRIASSASDAGGSLRNSGTNTPSAPFLGQMQVDLRAAAPPGGNSGYPRGGDSGQPSSRRRKLREAREAHRAAPASLVPRRSSKPGITRLNGV